jgi:hypothetical protein
VLKVVHDAEASNATGQATAASLLDEIVRDGAR